METYYQEQNTCAMQPEIAYYVVLLVINYTNNGCERALRIEKCMLNSSKFSKTKGGRATLDILRTINATCTAASLDLTDYLIYVYCHKDLIETAPQQLTPYAVAKSLQDLAKLAPNCSTK